jgi:hypothetical protein
MRAQVGAEIKPIASVPYLPDHAILETAFGTPVGSSSSLPWQSFPNVSFSNAKRMPLRDIVDTLFHRQNVEIMRASKFSAKFDL